MNADDDLIVLLDEDDTERLRRDAVARRAYELFLARGRAHGRHLEDWLRAEREIAARGID